jgi:hypothetical protein
MGGGEKKSCGFDNSSMSAEGLQDSTRDVIIELLRDENILDIVATMNNMEKRLDSLLTTIADKATPISRAIRDQYYDTHTDCCPTYWSLMRHLV